VKYTTYRTIVKTHLLLVESTWGQRIPGVTLESSPFSREASLLEFGAGSMEAGALGLGPWALGWGLWALGGGRWALGGGRWAGGLTRSPRVRNDGQTP